MKKIIVGIIVLAVVVWGGVKLFGTKEEKTKEAIKIGVLIPITGLASAIGEDNRQGLEIAKEDLLIKYSNLKLEILYEDTAYDAKIAVNGYHKLRDVNKVGVIISGGTKISGPIRALAQVDKVLQMAIWSAAPSYSDTHDLNYRTTPMSDDNVPVLINYLVRNKLKTLAIFYTNDEFGVTYKEAFEKFALVAGIDLVIVDGYIPTGKDFRVQLAKIKSKKPQAMFVAGTAPNLGNIFKQAREIGIDARFISQGAAENKQMLDGALGAAEGLIYSYYFNPASKYAKDFADKYFARHSKVASQYAAEAYTGLMLIGEAVNYCDNKANNDCLKNYIDNFQNSPTVLGLATINKQGDLKPDDVFLKTVKNGQFVKYEE